MDPLTAALTCAMALTDLPLPPALPRWEERELTSEERLLTNRPRNACAMYDSRTMTIVSPPDDWPGPRSRNGASPGVLGRRSLRRVPRQCRRETRQQLPELADH